MTTLYEMPIAAEEDRDRVVRELRRKRAEERLAIFGALRKCALGIPDLLGVSVFTIRRLIKAGEIRAVHVGARVLVPAAEIERVANHAVGVARVGKPRTSAKVRQRKCELAIAPGDLLQELNRKPYPLLLFGGGQTDGLGRRRLWHLGHLPSPTCWN